MKVVIAHFGEGNKLWPRYLEQNLIPTTEDESFRPLFLAGDREGYISECIRSIKTVSGRTPARSIASRWFKIGIDIAETNGDFWIHKESNNIWWTITLPGPVSAQFETTLIETNNKRSFYFIFKPTTKWSNHDHSGR